MTKSYKENLIFMKKIWRETLNKIITNLIVYDKFSYECI